MANVGPILALANIGPILARCRTTLDQYCTNIQPICNQYYLLYLSFSRFPLLLLIPVGVFSFPGIRNGKTHSRDSRGITGNPGKHSVSTEESSRRDLTLVHINLQRKMLFLPPRKSVAQSTSTCSRLLPDTGLVCRSIETLPFLLSQRKACFCLLHSMTP